MSDQTRVDAVRALIEKVEAREFTPSPADARAPFYNRFCDLADVALPQDVQAISVLAFDAYNGSLDAALALHEALTPEWAWHATLNGDEFDVDRGDPHRGSYETRNGTSAVPARSWLLAILRAHLTTLETPDE